MFMITVKAKKLIRLALIALLGPACLSNGPVTVVFFPDHTAVLRGSQVFPATASVATGSATFKIATTETTIDFNVTHDATSPVSVDVHIGTAGSNGPVILTLGLIPVSTPTTGTLTPADFTPAPTQGINSFVNACDAMMAGNTYVSVTTAGFPNGEIRGQIGPVSMNASNLIGAHAVPPSTTTASASATFLVEQVLQPPALLPPTVQVTLTSSGLTLGAVTGVFVYVGSPTTASTLGNTIFTLFSAGTFTNPFSVTLTTAHFTPHVSVPTYDEALNALLSGSTYIEVETSSAATGPIRCQIGSMRFKTTTFDKTQEVTPPSGTGSGTAAIALNATQDLMSYMVTYTGLTGAPTSAAIHVAPASLNGPILFTLPSTTFASPLTGTLQGSDIDPGSGLLTFSEVIEALLDGKTYIELPTAANPSGEIRGQLGP
jgi:hypothetical protein